MKYKFIMMMGLPGSGKSSWAKKYAASHKNTVVISTDDIREEINGDAASQDNASKVFEIAKKRVKDALASGKNVIFDATNINSKRRMAFLNEIKKYNCELEIVVMATPLEECVSRNKNRERVVPEEVINRMLKGWHTPYWFEGWNKIRVIRSKISQNYDVSKFFDYDQNNPWHKYSLGKHEYLTAKYLDKITDDIELIQAGLLHDCGKPLCRVDDEDGISHYYSHENVGAYLVLSTYGTSLRVSALINYHMRPLYWDSAKNPDGVEGKYRRLWGEKFFDDVVTLSDADRESER